MAQADYGTIVAAQTSGAALAAKLNAQRDADHTTHSGAQRPSYIKPGMMWLDTGATPWVLNLWTGSADVAISRVNANTGSLAPIGSDALADDAVTFAKMQNVSAGLIGRTSGLGDPGLVGYADVMAALAGFSPEISASGALRIPFATSTGLKQAILQWGVINGPNADYVVPFTIGFPNPFLSLSFGPLSAGEGLAAVVFGAEAITGNGFTVRRRLISNGGAIQTTTAAGYYLALGY